MSFRSNANLVSNAHLKSAVVSPNLFIFFLLEPKGCEAVVKLEHLKQHIIVCEYNPKGEIVCDKGCNLKITRLEYQVNDCLTHLADRLRLCEENNRNLDNELKGQKEHFEYTIKLLKEKNTELSGNNNYLSGRVSRYDSVNKKLISEIKKQKEKYQRKVRRLEDAIKKLNAQWTCKQEVIEDAPDTSETPIIRWETLRSKPTATEIKRRKILVKRRKTERLRFCPIHLNNQSGNVND